MKCVATQTLVGTKHTCLGVPPGAAVKSSIEGLTSIDSCLITNTAFNFLHKKLSKDDLYLCSHLATQRQLSNTVHFHTLSKHWQ